MLPTTGAGEAARVGKDADKIVLDGPPLSIKTWVQRVYVDGELVHVRKANSPLGRARCGSPYRIARLRIRFAKAKASTVGIDLSVSKPTLPVGSLLLILW
jgi:hypothetical protein